MKPEDIYEISLFSSELNDNLLGESFKRTLITGLYQFFEPETIVFILRDTFKESSLLNSSEIKNGKYIEDKISIRAFTDRFDFSIFDVEEQYGVVDDLSVGITQKVLHFEAQGVDCLVILKDIRRKEFLHDSLFRLIVSILNLSINNWITIRELYRTVTIQRYREDMDNLDHELRNLINSIKTANKSLSLKDLGENETVAHHAIIQRATDELTEILDDINETRRIEMVDLKKGLEVINISGLINEALEHVKLLSLNKNITININGIKEPLIKGNREWLGRAFYHLLLNAVRYNRMDGSVEINIAEDKGHYSITIADTGIGLPEGIKDNIFKKNVYGTEYNGMGIYIVKKVIEGHKGKISFESNKDRGTTFRIELPRQDKVKKGMPILFIIFILFLFLITTLPLIPGKPQMIKAPDGLMVLRLKEGTTLRIRTQSDVDYSYSSTILKYRGRLRLNIKDGTLNIDSGRTRLSIDTPHGSIKSKGSSFDALIYKDKISVSVFKGDITVRDEIIEYGEGSLINGNDIEIMPIPYQVKNINYENNESGRLRLEWMPVENAISYTIFIARDPLLSEIIAYIETDTNHSEVIIDKDGYYYVRIYPSDKHGLKGFPITLRLKNLYHLSKGIHERKKENYEEALNEFKLSFDDFKGKEEQPLSEIAWTYYLLGNYDIAEKKFKDAIKIQKTDRSILGLARIYLFKNDFKSSETLYKKLLSENPENADALWGLADLYLKKENISDAQEYLIKLSKINERYPLLNYSIARMHLLKGNKKEAIKHLNLELRYNPNSTEALSLLKELKTED